MRKTGKKVLNLTGNRARIWKKRKRKKKMTRRKRMTRKMTLGPCLPLTLH
jgi:hypothetical protein